jgi:hypothetical protein
MWFRREPEFRNLLVDVRSAQLFAILLQRSNQFFELDTEKAIQRRSILILRNKERSHHRRSKIQNKILIKLFSKPEKVFQIDSIDHFRVSKF